MPNVVNYATAFEPLLRQKYTDELLTSGLTTENVQVINGNTIKIPYVSVGGYKDHSRNGGFNRQSVQNSWITKTLMHDRDVELFVDTMDVEETNQALAAAKTTATFESEQAIPETDVYRLSKIYADFTELGGVPDTEELTVDNALYKFDKFMEKMDENEVPQEGRLLYVTPAVYTLLKRSQDIQRQITVNGVNDNGINRAVRTLDDVTIVKVPSGRMKTVYNFSDGYAPGVGAGQINMILIHPRSVIAINKHSFIKLWLPESHTEGDGWLYQNRQYWDLFVLDTRVNGIAINVTPSE
jgi:hypothetical protein